MKAVFDMIRPVDGLTRAQTGVVPVSAVVMNRPQRIGYSGCGAYRNSLASGQHSSRALSCDATKMAASRRLADRRARGTLLERVHVLGVLGDHVGRRSRAAQLAVIEP